MEYWGEPTLQRIRCVPLLGEEAQKLFPHGRISNAELDCGSVCLSRRYCASYWCWGWACRDWGKGVAALSLVKVLDTIMWLCRDALKREEFKNSISVPCSNQTICISTVSYSSCDNSCYLSLSRGQEGPWGEKMIVLQKHDRSSLQL